jgi:hypothetical protein
MTTTFVSTKAVYCVPETMADKEGGPLATKKPADLSADEAGSDDYKASPHDASVERGDSAGFGRVVKGAGKETLAAVKGGGPAAIMKARTELLLAPVVGERGSKGRIETHDFSQENEWMGLCETEQSSRVRKKRYITSTSSLWRRRVVGGLSRTLLLSVLLLLLLGGTPLCQADPDDELFGLAFSCELQTLNLLEYEDAYLKALYSDSYGVVLAKTRKHLELRSMNELNKDIRRRLTVVSGAVSDLIDEIPGDGFPGAATAASLLNSIIYMGFPDSILTLLIEGLDMVCPVPPKDPPKSPGRFPKIEKVFSSITNPIGNVYAQRKKPVRMLFRADPDAPTLSFVLSGAKKVISGIRNLCTKLKLIPVAPVKFVGRIGASAMKPPADAVETMEEKTTKFCKNETKRKYGRLFLTTLKGLQMVHGLALKGETVWLYNDCKQ